jgi:hypothetical protein
MIIAQQDDKSMTKERKNVHVPVICIGYTETIGWVTCHQLWAGSHHSSKTTLKERIFYYALGNSLLALVSIVLDSDHRILLLAHEGPLQRLAQAILFA